MMVGEEKNEETSLSPAKQHPSVTSKKFDRLPSKVAPSAGGVVEENEAGAGSRTLSPQAGEGTDGAEKLQPKKPSKAKRTSGLQIFAGLGRRLSSGASSGSAGQSPSSADSKFTPIIGVSVEEAMRLMRASADVLEVGGLMLTHSSEREVQLVGFKALLKVWGMSPSSSSSSPAASSSPSSPSSVSWRLEMAEGYIEAVVRGMRAHLDDLEVQQKGVRALQDVGHDTAFEGALRDTGLAAVKLAMKRHPATFGDGLEVGGVVLKRASCSLFEEITAESRSPTVRAMGRRLSDAMQFSKRLSKGQGD
ncbi:hypothetical protein T484DRAFT_1760801 [Baffinella frigidus]|nr:hypothetical protein T484DRAFT_1760801 [Cryptophyta sp. CCMP2293]